MILKKNRWVWALAVLMLLPTEMKSQDIEELTKTVIGLFGGSKNKNKGKSSTETVKENTATEDEGEVAVVGETMQQRSGVFRIVTNHPDFKVKVQRCEVSGKTCVIDMTFENVGSQDVIIRSGKNLDPIAYDDEANQYTNIEIAMGDISSWMWSGTLTLMSEIPIKARVQIEGVSDRATVFRRLQIPIMSDAWKLGTDKPLTFHNLPITREGDE